MALGKKMTSTYERIALELAELAEELFAMKQGRTARSKACRRPSLQK